MDSEVEKQEEHREGQDARAAGEEQVHVFTELINRGEEDEAHIHLLDDFLAKLLLLEDEDEVPLLQWAFGTLTVHVLGSPHGHERPRPEPPPPPWQYYAVRERDKLSSLIDQISEFLHLPQRHTVQQISFHVTLHKNPHHQAHPSSQYIIHQFQFSFQLHRPVSP